MTYYGDVEATGNGYIEGIGDGSRPPLVYEYGSICGNGYGHGRSGGEGSYDTHGFGDGKKYELSEACKEGNGYGDSDGQGNADFSGYGCG